MRKTYTIVTNMTFVSEERTLYATEERREKLSNKEVKELLAFWNERGQEYIVGKKRLTVMINVIHK